jgi:histidyl-tRNA synthetase
MGPMFRHERPQKGRFRQFYQFGVEVFGLAGPDIDAELLLMSARFWKALKISEKVVLHINTIGTKQARALYKKKLVEYFSANSALLDQDSKRRLNTNPLRILDSKNPDLAGLIKNAPKLLDHLDSESQEHFDGLCRILDKAKLPFIIDPCLVRGLDYYGLTVFEWVTTEPGAQNAICAGGHYDELVEELGGKATPALGFAVGLERLIDLVASDQKINYENPPHAYMIMLGDNAVISGVLLAEKLRNLLPNLQIIVNCGDGNLTNQLKKADKSGALFALILGEEEMRNEEITIKNLRTTNTKKFEQMRVKINELENFFTSLE